MHFLQSYVMGYDNPKSVIHPPAAILNNDNNSEPQTLSYRQNVKN